MLLLRTCLVDRDDISQPHSQVLADNLIDPDSCFFHGVVHQDDTHSVLSLLALQQVSSLKG